MIIIYYYFTNQIQMSPEFFVKQLVKVVDQLNFNIMFCLIFHNAFHVHKYAHEYAHANRLMVQQHLTLSKIQQPRSSVILVCMYVRMYACIACLYVSHGVVRAVNWIQNCRTPRSQQVYCINCSCWCSCFNNSFYLHLCGSALTAATVDTH